MDLSVLEKRERHLAQMRAWRERNRDRQNELARQWRAKNPERAAELVEASRRRHWEKNSEARRAQQRRTNQKRYYADPTANTAAVQAWRQANPGRAREHRASRRAAELKATPAWVDRDAIRRVYEMAAFLDMTVDHIEPLQGKNACGLHVPWNLQLLTARENSAKGNRSPSESL